MECRSWVLRRLISSLAAYSVDVRCAVDPQYTQSVALPTDRRCAVALEYLIATLISLRWRSADDLLRVRRRHATACSGDPALPTAIAEALEAKSSYLRVIRSIDVRSASFI